MKKPMMDEEDKEGGKKALFGRKGGKGKKFGGKKKKGRKKKARE